MVDVSRPPKEANSKVADFLKELRSAVHRHSLTQADTPFEVTIFFCCLARGFTSQGAEEFARISQEKSIEYGNQRIRLSTIPIFLDDLIAERWRESNTDWRTSTNERDNTIELHVRGEMISSAKSAVFFTNAHDLVTAFDRFVTRCSSRMSGANSSGRR